ncbi:DNA recombination protein RmuC [Erythrobacteraceae bacterium CFH 75059]|uniref:DNA recombination protein RmuC n=1 Tax=Qipengyuania thermophila TaxID=2509361 RepID=UPI001020F72D|nr:DNA recombination protein RmuC [Qipengyuania thermophila]TCD02279.1 DNA recombination protein RmuC [Erythrobacteraceae bacterium CFH 75059]
MESYALLVVAGFAAGVVLGWLLGTRPLADWKARHAARDAEAKELEAKYLRAFADADTARVQAARVEPLERQLDEMRAAHADALDRERTAHAAALEPLQEKVRVLSAEVATLKANAANFEEQKRLLVEAREALLKEFQLTGSKVLGHAQEEFLKSATERLGSAEKANKEAVANLLKPVSERLQRYEEQVAALEEKRADAFSHLHGQIEGLRAGQEAVRREAQRLGNSLTNAPKARGRWGERALQNLLEQCGLAQHTDFILEHSVDGGEGRLRPDAIVRIPGGKVLVIDSKVSLNAYQEAFEADSEEAKAAALKRHVASMRSHVQALADKSYQSQFEDAPDYVIMFVPGEHFVTAALDHEPGLWDFAFERRVLLATPTNLVALARTVAQVWRQDALAREAREIGRYGAELYDRLRVASEHLKRVGSGLDTAVNNYNRFVGSFDRNVLSAGRRLAEKGVEIGRTEIPDVPLVEAAPRHNAANTPEQLPEWPDAAE